MIDGLPNNAVKLEAMIVVFVTTILAVPWMLKITACLITVYTSSMQVFIASQITQWNLGSCHIKKNDRISSFTCIYM